MRDVTAKLDGFTFSRRVRVRTVAADKTGEARPGAEAEIVVE